MLASGYTVTFKLNGGQGSSPADQFVTRGGRVKKPADPARDGHTFAGWYNGQALWDFESDTVTGPLELTAMWIQNPETTAVSGNLSLPYKTQGAQISVTVAQQSGHSYSYQWYRGTAEDGSDKAPLSEATESTYELPEDLPLGTLYYFCEITADIPGSPERSAVISGPIAVEIRARDYEEDKGITVTPIGEQPFRGSPLQPKPEISCGFDLLREGIDYDLAYGENTDVGTGTVTVIFKGSYTGQTTLNFPIAYASLPDGKRLGDYVEIPAPNGAGWYRQEIVLTPKEDVNIGTGDDAEGGVAIAKEGEDLTQVLFIKDEEGNIFRAGFSYSLDMTDPTAGELSPPRATGRPMPSRSASSPPTAPPALQASPWKSLTEANSPSPATAAIRLKPASTATTPSPSQTGRATARSAASPSGTLTVPPPALWSRGASRAAGA